VSEEKLLSVIIPSYNHAKLLPRAVHSVLAHADSRVELIVVDDGSEDDTPAVMAQLSQQYGERFRGVRCAHRGLAATRNEAVQLAQGDFILPLDADDELQSSALSELLPQLAAQPDVRFWLAAHQSVQPDGKTRIHKATHAPLPEDLKERLSAWMLDKRIKICQGAYLIRRDLLLEYLYPNLPSTEDLPVFAKALLEPKIVVLDLVLASIHKSPTSKRHDVKTALQQGLALVDEVFRLLPNSVQTLKPQYFAQCCLSLFRTCYVAGEYQKAKEFYQQALKSHWPVLFKLSYTRKALRLWLSFK